MSGETDDKERIVPFGPIHMQDKHGPAEIFPSTLSHKKWAWPEAVLCKPTHHIIQQSILLPIDRAALVPPLCLWWSQELLTAMGDIKRRKVAHGAQKNRHVPMSSPPRAPSSESEASSDQEESATLDEAVVEESDTQPKTFKELVSIEDAPVLGLCSRQCSPI